MAKQAVYEEHLQGTLTDSQLATLQQALASMGLIPGDGAGLLEFRYALSIVGPPKPAHSWVARVSGEANADDLVDMADAGRAFTFKGAKK